MAKILDGKAVAAAINADTAAMVQSLAEKGITPTLAVVRVGENPDDIAYEKGVLARCKTTGVQVDCRVFPADIAEDEFLAALAQIDADGEIHGILMFRPLPRHISEGKASCAISPAKDVDGITGASMAAVLSGGGEGFAPCTAQACMEILDHYNIPIEGKQAVVVGRSLVVGKPVAMMMLGRNATVTLCHTRTQDIAAECRRADILIVAAGRAKVIGCDCFRAGQAIIDVGINVDERGRLCGDVDCCEGDIVGAYTPVPGGVGTVTTSVLIRNVARAAVRC